MERPNILLIMTDQQRYDSLGCYGAGMSPEDLQHMMPESQNLVPLIEGKDEPVHDSAICYYRNTGISDQGVYWDPPIHATMIRDKRYKLNIYHADPATSRSLQGELYDMREDPQELHNLWEHPDYTTIQWTLTKKLLDWLFTQELHSGSRGGEAIPDPSQQLVNALK